MRIWKADFRQSEELSDSLNSKLWDSETHYLMNYLSDDSQDNHFYMGSLTGVHFGLLDSLRSRQLVETAEEELLAPDIGIRNAAPMDFHLLEQKYNLLPGEAGQKGIYANGGVWPHANAFYALALGKIGRSQEEFDFIRSSMTVHGIMNSPNGQPAMYEYRNSNDEDVLNFGKIDKPNFTWAAGWFIYCLYDVLGVREDDENIRIQPFLPNGLDEASFPIAVNGKTIDIKIEGTGENVISTIGAFPQKASVSCKIFFN